MVKTDSAADDELAEGESSAEWSGSERVGGSKRLSINESRPKPAAMKHMTLPKGAVTGRTPEKPQSAATNATTNDTPARLSMREFRCQQGFGSIGFVPRDALALTPKSATKRHKNSRKDDGGSQSA